MHSRRARESLDVGTKPQRQLNLPRRTKGAVAVDVIRPKFEEPQVEAGCPKFTWFLRLKSSIRKSSDLCSPAEKVGARAVQSVNAARRECPRLSVQPFTKTYLDTWSSRRKRENLDMPDALSSFLTAAARAGFDKPSQAPTRTSQIDDDIANRL